MGYFFHVVTWTLQWRHNECGGVLNHQPQDCLLHRLFGRRSKKTSKLRVTGLCEGNSSVTGEFPAKRAGNAENVSIWWRHHGVGLLLTWSSLFSSRWHAVWLRCSLPWLHSACGSLWNSCSERSYHSKASTNSLAWVEDNSFQQVWSVTSSWAWWRFKSPGSRLFTPPFIRAQIKENVKAWRHGPFKWDFVREIHRWPVNSPHKGPVMRKMFPFDDVIMF